MPILLWHMIQNSSLRNSVCIIYTQWFNLFQNISLPQLTVAICLENGLKLSGHRYSKSNCFGVFRTPVTDWIKGAEFTSLGYYWPRTAGHAHLTHQERLSVPKHTWHENCLSFRMWTEKWTTVTGVNRWRELHKGVHGDLSGASWF